MVGFNDLYNGFSLLTKRLLSFLSFVVGPGLGGAGSGGGESRAGRRAVPRGSGTAFGQYLHHAGMV